MNDIPTYFINNEIIDRVTQDAKKVGDSHKGSATERIYKPGQGIIGGIGEKAFGLWLVDKHIYNHEVSDPGLRLGGDKWDFLVNGKSVDVKTIEKPDERYADLDKHEVFIEDHQTTKPIDYYVFVLYRSDIQYCFICGWATLEMFKSLPSYRHINAGEPLYRNSQFKAKGNTNAVLAKELQPMTTFKDAVN